MTAGTLAAPAAGAGLRDATEADLPAIVAIFNATIPSRLVTAELEPVSVASRAAWFRQHSPNHHPLWVAEAGAERVAGWLSFERFRTRAAYGATAEVSVYVQEQFRRAGIGRQLLAQAIARGPGLGMETLVGCIFAQNEPSLRLFARLGFARWGLLPRVARLDGVAADVVIVGRHLI